jgi:AAA+ ATPase superfamily predicted ATPase
MTLKPFVGRQKELETVRHLWEEQTARMIVLYGRRRVGKSRLLKHWIQETGHGVVYWQAEPDTKEAHLREFSQVLFNHSSPGFPAPVDFSYASWEQALAQIGLMAQHERLGVVIDEFTFLVASDATISASSSAFGIRRWRAPTCYCVCQIPPGNDAASSLTASVRARSAKLHLMPLSFD